MRMKHCSAPNSAHAWITEAVNHHSTVICSLAVIQTSLVALAIAGKYCRYIGRILPIPHIGIISHRHADVPVKLRCTGQTAMYRSNSDVPAKLRYIFAPGLNDTTSLFTIFADLAKIAWTQMSVNRIKVSEEIGLSTHERSTAFFCITNLQKNRKSVGIKTIVPTPPTQKSFGSKSDSTALVRITASINWSLFQNISRVKRKHQLA